MFVPEYLIEQTIYALYEVLLQYNEFVDLWIIGWKIALYVISPARLFSNTCFETQTSKVALGISQIESSHDSRQITYNQITPLLAYHLCIMFRSLVCHWLQSLKYSIIHTYFPFKLQNKRFKCFLLC